jgi:hypothetical protein
LYEARSRYYQWDGPPPLACNRRGITRWMRAQRIPSRPGACAPTKAVYIFADQPNSLLQTRMVQGSLPQPVVRLMSAINNFDWTRCTCKRKVASGTEARENATRFDRGRVLWGIPVYIVEAQSAMAKTPEAVSCWLGNDEGTCSNRTYADKIWKQRAWDWKRIIARFKNCN